MPEPKRKKIPGTCVFCYNFCEKGWDKNGHAYIRCMFCGTSLFMSTALAETGHSIMHDMVNENIKAFKDEQEKRLIEVRSSTNKTNKAKELDHTLGTMGIKLTKP